MKKSILLAMFLAAFGFFQAFAVPADPTPVPVVMPDGSSVTLILHGDEHMNFTTTSDGYTVVRRADGFYVYALLADNVLVPTNVVARDAAKRAAKEKSFLYGVSKFQHPVASLKADRMKSLRGYAAGAKPKNFDYSKFRGLIILANYNDCKFSHSDAHEFFDSLANYPGFHSTIHVVDSVFNVYTGDVSYFGSVRDYYHDNSLDAFTPHFDVVGPVDINYSCHYANGIKNGPELVKAACEVADKLVNFADYDLNNDGVADMVYVIFAGLGSAVAGNDTDLLWPHSFFVSAKYDLSLDNTKIDSYACSNELIGFTKLNALDGIGTISHEFGHVLGLPDVYDTDYSGSGGQSADPQTWLLMATGCHNFFGRVPAALGSYDRYSLGFASPQVISSVGEYSLNPITTSNECYRINSGQDSVYFLLENRQLAGWDTFVPGHGLLIFRVDSTDVQVWVDNTVNCDPSHNYFELLRASKTYNSENSVVSSKSDPFPGSAGITAINNSTIPNLRTWSGLDCPFGLSNITESNGVITFTVVNAPSAVTAVKASPSSFTAVRCGNVITVTTSDSALPISLYRADGVLLNRVKVVGSADFILPSHGLFIVNQGNVSQKIMY
jgi:immune inhibitor A